MSVVLILLAVLAVGRSLRTWTAYRWLRFGPGSPDGNQPPFVVLLPAYREQSLVAGTLAHFAALDYPPDLFRVVVVTSERERTEFDALSATVPAFVERLWRASQAGGDVDDDLLTGHLPGVAVQELLAEPAADLVELTRRVEQARARWGVTADVVDAEAARINAVFGRRVVHRIGAPAREWFKAGQVRHAFDVLDDEMADWPALADCRYVGIYDFDARPCPATLRAAADAAASGAALLQQLGIAIPRPRAGATLRHRLFAEIEGAMHTRRALRVELGGLLTDARLRALPDKAFALLRSGVYTVGIGLYVDRAQLPALGGVPAVVEDLCLGWRAAVTGATVAAVRCPVRYDAYQSPRQAARSRSFVFEAYLRAAADLSSVDASPRWVRGVQRARIAASAAEWLGGGYPRLVLYLVAALVVPDLAAGVVGLGYALLLVDVAVAYRLWRCVGGGDSRRPTVRLVAALAAPAQLLWRGSGPRLAVRRRLRHQTAADALVTTKTER